MIHDNVIIYLPLSYNVKVVIIDSSIDRSEGGSFWINKMIFEGYSCLCSTNDDWILLMLVVVFFNLMTVIFHSTNIFHLNNVFTGLRTALELLKHNISVVIRSAKPSLHESTCSMGAGGLWMPYKCDDKRIDKWAIETLDELLHTSKSQDKKNLVEIVPTLYLTSKHRGPTINDFIELKDENKPQKYDVFPEWTRDERISFQHLTVEMLCWQNQVLKLRIPSQEDLISAGYTHAWLFHPPVVDPPRMLTVSSKVWKSVNLVKGTNFVSLRKNPGYA